MARLVGERPVFCEALPEGQGGEDGSENAGISSEIPARIWKVESPRVPRQRSSFGGKAGTKPRPNGIGDVQPVDIPVPLISRYYLGRDALGELKRCEDDTSKPRVSSGRKIRRT